MRIIPAALFGTLLMTVLAPSAAAAVFGTRQEAIEMVRRVQAKVKDEGVGATVQAITTRPKEFIDRDLYPFIIRLDGIMLADALTPPSVTGSNVNDLRDEDGKFFVRAMLSIAKDTGSGWVDYRWLNPVTKMADEKSAYIERLGDRYLVGVGIYKSEQPTESLSADRLRYRRGPQRPRQPSRPADRRGRRPAQHP
jgi:signal transduction histidine kinase